MGSSFARKNCWAPSPPSASLRRFPARHLATRSLPPTPPGAAARLREAAAGAANISIHDRVLSRAELQGWLANADAVMSLHRAEGFGLVPAEAMQLGRPVIATRWSGNIDFMTAENSALVDYSLVPAVDPQGTYHHPDQLWAEPDVAHAADWLRRLAADRDLGRRLGERAGHDRPCSARRPTGTGRRIAARARRMRIALSRPLRSLVGGLEQWTHPSCHLLGRARVHVVAFAEANNDLPVSLLVGRRA
jgi:glycosyltransferase involved in cell wall biosynthesis